MKKLMRWVLDNQNILIIVAAVWIGILCSLSLWWRLIEEMLYGVSQASAVDTVAAMILATICTYIITKRCER